MLSFSKGIHAPKVLNLSKCYLICKYQRQSFYFTIINIVTYLTQSVINNCFITNITNIKENYKRARIKIDKQ